MKTFRIKTTGYSEEDLLITTDLFDKVKITKVLTPLIKLDRKYQGENNGTFLYSNTDFVTALQKEYPDNIIINVDYDLSEIIIL